MLKKRMIAKSVLDGFMQSLALCLICVISAAEFMSDRFVAVLVVAALAPIALAAFGQIVLRKESERKSIIALSIIAFASFCIFTLLIFALRITCPIAIPQRELNNADGITLLFVLGIYTGATLLIRIALTAYNLIKNR